MMTMMMSMIAPTRLAIIAYLAKALDCLMSLSFFAKDIIERGSETTSNAMQHNSEQNKEITKLNMGFS